MNKLETYTFEAPAHYACPLINGDCSGMNDDDQAEFDAWVAAHPAEAREVVGCSEDQHIGRWKGLLTELLTFTALRSSVK
jgi:hypothetical protein